MCICMMDMSCQTGQGEGHTALNGPPHRNRGWWRISQTPRKSFLIKAAPCPFVILLCIISMLQLSVAIRPAFFMQINLTAQQSVSYASCCSLILPSTPSLPLPSPSLLPHFLWHLQRLLHLHYLSYKVRICTTQAKSIWLLAQYYKC